MKTIEEIKDEVAKEAGWSDWRDYFESAKLDGLSNEVARRYIAQIINEIDDELVIIEDLAHGEVGNAITKLRGKIQDL